MKQDPEVLRAFLADYEAYVHAVLQPIQADLRERFAPWLRPEFWEKYKRTDRIPIPSPVRTTLSRIKRPEQVVDKIFRKPQEFPLGLVPQSFRSMRDALGVRILVYCLSHLPLIDRELRGCEDWEESVDRLQTRTLELKARYWAGRLKDQDIERGSLKRNPGSEIRSDLTRQAMMLEGINTDMVEARGDTPMAQLWSLLHFGDYVAYYLAMAYGVDPTPISALENLKREMSAVESRREKIEGQGIKAR